MRYFALIHLVCLHLLFGCSSSENSDEVLINYAIGDFPNEKSLYGEKFEYDNILNPRKILSKNDYLIVSEKGFGNLIHVLDKKRMGYLNSTGKQGDGPGEITSGIWSLDAGTSQDSFWAYDLSGKSFYQYGLSDTISYAKKTIRQQESWFLGYSIQQIDANKFISYLSRDSFKFGVFDSLGNRISSIRPWSFTDSIDEMTGYILMSLNQGPIHFNSDIGVLGHAGIKYEFIEIININTGQFIRLLGPSGFELSYEIKGNTSNPVAQIDSEIPRGFRDLYVGRDSIFLIYIGKTLEESQKDRSGSSRIFKFSLDGKPLSIFNLDYPIRALTVDEFSQKIYGVTTDKNPGIAVFDY